MQTSENQKPFFPLQTKTKQNLDAGSSTYHDTEHNLFWCGNGRAGQMGSVFICRLIEHNWSQAIAHRLASKPIKISKKELVSILLCRRRLSTEWRSQGKRRCSTPSSDAPAKPSPCYLQDTYNIISDEAVHHVLYGQSYSAVTNHT